MLTNQSFSAILKLRIIPNPNVEVRTITKQRQMILDIIRADSSHPTADIIYLKAKKKMPSIAVGTVYRNLNLMCEAGEIRKIALPDAADRYDKSIIPHDHLICTECEKMVDIGLGDLLPLIEERSGAKVHSYELCIHGICAECLDSKNQ